MSIDVDTVCRCRRGRASVCTEELFAPGFFSTVHWLDHLSLWTWYPPRRRLEGQKKKRLNREASFRLLLQQVFSLFLKKIERGDLFFWSKARWGVFRLYGSFAIYGTQLGGQNSYLFILLIWSAKKEKKGRREGIFLPMAPNRSRTGWDKLIGAWSCCCVCVDMAKLNRLKEMSSSLLSSL